MSRIYSSVSNYFRKHRRFITITATLVGGTYLIGRYAKQKFLELQEKNDRDRTAKENLRRRFEQNLMDCTYVVMSLLPTLSDYLLTELDLEVIIKQARQVAVADAGTPELSNPVSHKDPHRHESDGSSEQSQDEGGSASIGSIASVEGSGVIVDDPSQIGGDSTVFVKSEHENSTPEKEGNDESSSSSASSSPKPVAQKPVQSTKQELWEEIKILSFSRTFTALYTLTLINLLTHIQVNLLGRYTYLSSVAALNRNDQTITLESVNGTSGSESRTRGILDSETEGKYLSFSWWILARGWRIIEKKVRKAVEDVLGPVSLRRTVTAAELETLIAEIRTRIEDPDESNGIGSPWADAMLPLNMDSEHEVLINAYYSLVSPTSVIIESKLRDLLDETKDFIDSADFQTVLAAMLDEVFQILSSKTMAKLFENTTSGQMHKIMEVRDDDDDEEVRVPILKSLSPIDKEIHIILNGRPNDYVEALSCVKELQGFSAIIYSSFDEHLLT